MYKIMYDGDRTVFDQCNATLQFQNKVCCKIIRTKGLFYPEKC